jgi:hypothetical protein
LILFALVCAASAATAQAPAQPELRRVIDVQIKPDAVAAWSKLHREEFLPAQRKAGLPWMDVWASATSGNPYMRTLVTPVATLAELDDRTLLQKALGDSRAEDLLERNRQMVESVHTYIMRPRPDLGFGTAPARRSIGLISKITVAPGRAEEFEQLLKQGVAESLKEANVSSFVVLQVVYGGDPNQYRTVLSFDTHEQVASGHGDPIPWLETHGQRVGTDGLARQPGSPILSLERTIITYMPNLSFRPEPR